MQESLQQVFVYGSLRRGFQHPAYAYISRYFSLVAEAKVKGCLYDMGEFPAAVPEPEGERFIVGELYRINHPNEFNWAMAQLDDYEGLNVEANELPLYRREPATIYLQGQPAETAWIYWFNGNVNDKPVVESGDVLQYMQQKKQR